MEKKFNDCTFAIINAAIEVHKELGRFLMEKTYQRALELELSARGLEYNREVNIPIYFKGRKIDTRRVDFVVEDVIVEIKAKSEFAPEDYMQTLCYLKASNMKV